MMTGVKRKVEVIEFKDPTKRQRVDKVSRLETKDDGFSMKSAMRDVAKLGQTGLSKQSKKSLENQYIESLGGKVASGPKMPIKMLQGVRAVTAKRERKWARVNKAGDVVLGIKKKKHSDGGIKKGKGGGDALAPVRKLSFKSGVLSVAGK